MGMSNKEKARVYRERLYAAGFKPIRLWIPIKSDGSIVKKLVKLEEITANWSKNKRSKFLSDIIPMIRKKLKEVKQ